MTEMKIIVNFDVPGWYAGRQFGSHDEKYCEYWLMIATEDKSNPWLAEEARQEARINNYGTPFYLEYGRRVLR